MSTLTPEGQQLVQDLAQRHGFSIEAVTQMLTAVIAGNSRMAQFSHPEFGGNGQWMSGGMLMLGDMFNQSLKGRVDALCTDISNAVTASGRQVGPAQSQSQGNAGNAALPDTPFFSSASESSSGGDSNAWWPSDLGSPSSAGTQNSMRYAYFANVRRLAIYDKGDISIYDTLDHQISGFSQQQGGTARLALSSQHGTIELSTLPEVSQPEVAQSGASQSGADGPAGSDGPISEEVRLSADDPVRLIERLGELRERGILTDDEFAAKKVELLSRL